MHQKAVFGSNPLVLQEQRDRELLRYTVCSTAPCWSGPVHALNSTSKQNNKNFYWGQKNKTNAIFYGFVFSL